MIKLRLITFTKVTKAVHVKIIIWIQTYPVIPTQTLNLCSTLFLSLTTSPISSTICIHFDLSNLVFHFKYDNSLGIPHHQRHQIPQHLLNSHLLFLFLKSKPLIEISPKIKDERYFCFSYVFPHSNKNSW